GRKFVPSRKVNAIDTTGAGDVYNGALVAALSQGKSLLEAARIATLASSIAVTRLGAQTSAPYANEIDNL
ncbi:MAG: ribokinase, partial [Bacteroidales bacterium]|nr:ribokinase [Bacteroidales bacterium]